MEHWMQDQFEKLQQQIKYCDHAIDTRLRAVTGTFTSTNHDSKEVEEFLLLVQAKKALVETLTVLIDRGER
jgi:hypothetical protein